MLQHKSLYSALILFVQRCTEAMRRHLITLHLRFPCPHGGGEGAGREKELQLSMWRTEFIVGLASSFSCTHKSPTCMHLSILSVEPPFILGSMRFKAIPSLQFLHTCSRIQRFEKSCMYIILNPWVLPFLECREKGNELPFRLTFQLTLLVIGSTSSPLSSQKGVLLCPVTIFRSKTPKLNTLLFTEISRWIKVSGAMYPLQAK